MERLVRWLRMLGTTGAVANARSLSEERERERGVVESLMARLAITDQRATAA
jgi:uncharacterized protein with PIN domain